MGQGVLYVVATPIGHLKDITHRAVEVLQSVQVIAAEDTRHTQKLLQHYQIGTPCVSYHAHNERARTQSLVQRLLEGESIALVSDAGTPLIRDPGLTLTQAAITAGIQVSPIPGASALIAALSVAGLPADPFLFLGFLPEKPTHRIKQLMQYQFHTETLIAYEAPHRVLATLEAIVDVLGPERSVVVARELTKQFETLERGAAHIVLERFQSGEAKALGECVVLIAGYIGDRSQTDDILQQALMDLKAAGHTQKTVVAWLSQWFSVSKSTVKRQWDAMVVDNQGL